MPPYPIITTDNLLYGQTERKVLGCNRDTWEYGKVTHTKVKGRINHFEPQEKYQGLNQDLRTSIDTRTNQICLNFSTICAVHLNIWDFFFPCGDKLSWVSLIVWEITLTTEAKHYNEKCATIFFPVRYLAKKSGTSLWICGPQSVRRV